MDDRFRWIVLKGDNTGGERKGGYSERLGFGGAIGKDGVGERTIGQVGRKWEGVALWVDEWQAARLVRISIERLNVQNHKGYVLNLIIFLHITF